MTTKTDLTLFDAQMKLSAFSEAFTKRVEVMIAEGKESADEPATTTKEAVAAFKAFVMAWSHFYREQTGLSDEKWADLQREAGMEAWF